ncbi:MAG: extracellular solute-binding protein [Bacteroidetes bacterium]|nr:extracellular solute-binding protein [Bacteroidota bacterium]
MEKVLKGITWGHSRGLTPLLAAAQRYSELHPGITIHWEKRTLQQFADYPIEKLTETYDLLIIDHPWVGTAASLGCVLPLEEHLPAVYLKEQAESSIGYSHHSYEYGGHQWALAIDAATPSASCRVDLLDQAGLRIPETWEEVLHVAQMGKLAVPAIPIDLLMNFYMFCIAAGSRPFLSEEEVIDEVTGCAALETMRELYSLIDEKFFRANPIAVAEYMTTTDDYWYCPFAYGYSNYSRDGYARRRLTYADLVRMGAKGRLRSTIGGTGLAVSSFSKHPDVAVDFAAWVVSPGMQSTFYVEHGGQPGHRSAWVNDRANRLTNNFFYTLLPTMERGYMRPRYDGYLYFQDHAGDPLQEFLMGKREMGNVLEKMNELYRESRAKNPINVLV